jgi:hypothetical protein
MFITTLNMSAYGTMNYLPAVLAQYVLPVDVHEVPNRLAVSTGRQGREDDGRSD